MKQSPIRLTIHSVSRRIFSRPTIINGICSAVYTRSRTPIWRRSYCSTQVLTRHLTACELGYQPRDLMPLCTTTILKPTTPCRILRNFYFCHYLHYLPIDPRETRERAEGVINSSTYNSAHHYLTYINHQVSKAGVHQQQHFTYKLHITQVDVVIITIRYMFKSHILVSWRN